MTVQWKVACVAPEVLSIFHKYLPAIYIMNILKWYKKFISFLEEDKGLSILHIVISNSCWWFGSVRRQGISGNAIDIVGAESRRWLSRFPPGKGATVSPPKHMYNA